MALSEPGPHIDCLFGAETLTSMSTVFDDLDWWRRTLLASDDSLGPIVDRLPDSDVPAALKPALRQDLAALSPLVQSAILDALHLAVRDAVSLTITNDFVSHRGGSVSVSASGEHLRIHIGIYCTSN